MVNRVSLLAIVCALFALAVTVPAAAQNKAVEAQARQLETKAMQEDYLATDFDKALEKLNQAVSKCGTDKCGPLLRAQLKRDIGVIQGAGQNKRDAAIASFVEALKADAAVTLDPDLKTKEVEAEWDEAKKQIAGGGKGEPSGGGKGEPSGDFTHTPVAAQLVRTPVPIYAEYSGSEQLAKVVAKYKAFGMPDWKQLELKPMGKGFGGEVPCMEVQQGELQYYIQGFNAQNDPVAGSGDRLNAYKVPIKRDKIDGEPPHLPGREPAKQCADTGDCPPDFPGCKTNSGASSAESTLKGEGEDCEEDSECKSSTCKNKTCAAEGGAAPTGKFRRLWVGVAGQFDLTLLGSGSDVCKLHPPNDPTGPAATPVNSAGYYCVDNGADFPGRDPTVNDAIQLGRSDKVSGGLAPSNIRVMLTVDYAVTTNFLVGLRLGYVLNTYPGSAASAFPPIHAEARVTYVLGKDALAKAGLAPYVFVSGGVAEWDAQVAVTVIQTATPPSKTVQAWNIDGPGFASLGGGLRYAFTPRFAGTLGPRFNLLFGANGMTPSISPELGVAYGF